MKILYLSAAQAPDYLCDMLAHGLRSLGHEVVDVGRLWYLYKEEFENCDQEKIYGRGFSIYGLLEEGFVDRADIIRKIRSRYFDLVIYGSIHRCQIFLDEVESTYPPERIVFIDGEDHQGVLSGLITRGMYFKRELPSFNIGAKPIQFAIPKEKIGTHDSPKTDLVAYLDPRNKDTYIYKRESDYYEGYRKSLFAVTMKKGGWDCLRHYEILANGCMPNFLGLEDCPNSIMVGLPKCEILLCNDLIKTQGVEYFRTEQGMRTWKATLSRALTIFERFCTTEALAHYVITQTGEYA